MEVGVRHTVPQGNVRSSKFEPLKVLLTADHLISSAYLISFACAFAHIAPYFYSSVHIAKGANIDRTMADTKPGWEALKVEGNTLFANRSKYLKPGEVD
jgi:hypothetical protein